MYFLKKKKENIQNFELKNESLLFITNDSLFERKIYLNDHLLHSSGVSCFTSDLGERIVFGTWQPNIYSFENNEIFLLKEGFSLSEKKYDDDKIIISQRISRGNFKSYIYELSSKKILFEINTTPSFIYKNEEYFVNNNLISCCFIEDKITKWEVDLSEKLGIYDKILKVYGIVNDSLWAITERGILLGINVNDGMLIHHLNFDDYDNFQQYGTVQMQYFRSLFDEKQLILIGVYENRYWEIDLKADKPVLQITDIKALNPSYFNNPSFIYEVYHLAAPEGIAYNEQYIYFKDNEVSTVGVLNRQTKQIEWHDKLYELPGRSYVMIRDIQVAADKMYVLDEKGVLHIYEKE